MVPRLHRPLVGTIFLLLEGDNLIYLKIYQGVTEQIVRLRKTFKGHTVLSDEK